MEVKKDVLNVCDLSTPVVIIDANMVLPSSYEMI